MSVSSSPSSSVASKVLKRKKSSLGEARISVLGDENVGKSAIVVRFLTRRFIHEYQHGSDGRYRQELLIDNEPIIVDILDTSVQVDGNDLVIEDHLNCDVLLLIYSITDRQSFTYVRDALRMITSKKTANQLTIRDHPAPIVAIVGNKSDLTHLRQVSTEEGESLAGEFSEISATFMGDISAAEDTLHQLLYDLIKWLKKTKNIRHPPSLLDRVVIGIKSSSSFSSSGNGS